jgi:hypothetical protein
MAYGLFRERIARATDWGYLLLKGEQRQRYAAAVLSYDAERPLWHAPSLSGYDGFTGAS